jgi:hypothetical protein
MVPTVMGAANVQPDAHVGKYLYFMRLVLRG